MRKGAAFLKIAYEHDTLVVHFSFLSFPFISCVFYLPPSEEFWGISNQIWVEPQGPRNSKLAAM